MGRTGVADGRYRRADTKGITGKPQFHDPCGLPVQQDGLVVNEDLIRIYETVAEDNRNIPWCWGLPSFQLLLDQKSKPPFQIFIAIYQTDSPFSYRTNMLFRYTFVLYRILPNRDFSC